MRVGELLGIALVALMPANVGGQGRPFGSAEASAAGQAVMSAQIARYGRISNPAWDQVISGVLSKLLTTAAVSSVSLNWVIWGYPAERHDEVALAYTHVPALRKHKQLEQDTLFGYQTPTSPPVPETPRC